MDVDPDELAALSVAAVGVHMALRRNSAALMPYVSPRVAKSNLGAYTMYTASCMVHWATHPSLETDMGHRQECSFSLG